VDVLRRKSALLVEQIPSLRRYARALTGHADQADELVQDCLERAWSRLHLWRRGTTMRPWLFTIMHNLYVNAVRQGLSRPAMQSLDGLWQQAFRTASAGQRGLQLELGSTPGLQVRTRAPADVQGLTALLLFSHAAVGPKGSIPVTHERLDDARLASKVRLPAGIWERMGDDPAVLPPAPIEPIEWWLAVRGLARAGARVEVDRAAEGEPLRVVWSTM